MVWYFLQMTPNHIIIGLGKNILIIIRDFWFQTNKKSIFFCLSTETDQNSKADKQRHWDKHLNLQLTKYLSFKQQTRSDQIFCNRDFETWKFNFGSLNEHDIDKILVSIGSVYNWMRAEFLFLWKEKEWQTMGWKGWQKSWGSFWVLWRWVNWREMNCGP